jgi:hypothetical protein
MASVIAVNCWLLNGLPCSRVSVEHKVIGLNLNGMGGSALDRQPDCCAGKPAEGHSR